MSNIKVKEKPVAKLKNMTREEMWKFVVDNAIFFILLGLLLIIIALEPSFVSMKNLSNILSQSSTRIIFALGVGTIIVTKGTDLSLGRQVGLAAVISASLLQSADYAYKMYPDLPALPIFLPIILVMLVTATISLVNGFVVAKFKVDPFIATLGMMIIVYGLTSIYFDRPPFGAQPIGGLDKGFMKFAQGSIDFGPLSIPYLVIYASIAVAIMWVLWNKTKFGKNIFAIGGNQEAAIVSGVNVFKYILITYTLAGLLYGLGGSLEAARIGSATNNTGNMYELDAIAACIVGGLSFSGGIGSISGIVAGVLIFQVIAYGLSFIGVNPYIQFIIKGLIIITAVAIDNRKHIKKK
ncbi:MULTISPECIES: galactose/methyl galactoside ABC transporter permease MglC [unclassified Fusibacter]|uniref:galactose/methyl galactoside ABC transporter permease MglC n=1 Tax=unclassified Fusibacter TaxID=2624464 RepID=UPI001495136F|nr:MULTISPECIES: galactose/methyl galactoside ABC transporter permease MglC [unclassified Fusibacter]MCK8060074.1 galactose/methyl galactoside ABC transporter permease MglC [Fusibacter sp. A2]NPE22216.1 galactose/methyl galactoside ABC transporter permease MglC [Fusibacter sp. A1]